MIPATLQYIITSLFDTLVDVGRGFQYYLHERKVNDKNFCFSIVIGYRGERVVVVHCHLENSKIKYSSFDSPVESYEKLMEIKKVFQPIIQSTYVCPFDEFLRLNRQYISDLKKVFI